MKDCSACDLEGGGGERPPPVKACLIAPAFGDDARVARRPRPVAAALPERVVVDDAVRRAFARVRRERDARRRALVRAALEESRDGVIRGILARPVKRAPSTPTAVDTATVAAAAIPGANKRSKHGHARSTVAEEKKEEAEDEGAHGNGGDWNGEAQESPAHADDARRGKAAPTGTAAATPGPGAGIGGGHRALVFPRLPSNGCPPVGERALAIRALAPTDEADAETASTTRHRPLLLEGCHDPRPTSASLVFLTAGLVVDDRPALAHLEYFGDGDDEDLYSELYDTTERERRHACGARHEEEETAATVDAVLDRLGPAAGEEPAMDGPQGSGGGRATPDEVVSRALAALSGADPQSVCERVREHRRREQHTTPSVTAAERPAASSAVPGGDSGDVVKNSDATVRVPYESLMDSYSGLFCRRCFVYDCNLHGNLPKASVGLLGELAAQKEAEGHWRELDKDIVLDSVPKNGQRKKEHAIKDLTPAQQSICERACVIFQGNTDKIALAIGARTATVDAFVKSENIEQIHLRPNKFVTSQPSRKKTKNSKYTSMSNYNKKWLRHIQSKNILPAYLPCDQSGPCDDTCSCVVNGFFCTKACGWGCKSPNFFRGCECKAGQCRTMACPCFAANRECDPDLCRTCGACSDPPGAHTKGEGAQRCRNDGISMGRHCHLLIAESSIKEAGWGLFTKHALKKGDFVHEYVGEVISQEEAERRGVIYDKLNMSYLFNLTSDLSVDSTRKGNKSRYANHSSTPNIEPKMVHVNGDMRIGFYALHDIDAQSELFFDYRYDDKMDNELIFKPDHSVNFDWMNKNNEKRKKKKQH